MKIAFVIYPDMTALDFVGIFDPLTRLKTMGFMDDLTWEICAYTDAEVRDGAGLRFTPDKVGHSLGHYDMVVLPGGFGSRKLAKDPAFIDWLRTAARCPLKVSVCTGALLWGAAGFLADKPATTHPGAYDNLRDYCREVVPDRVVDAGDVITSRGVTAAIDIGLYLCEKLAGREAREDIRRQMDYQC
ncbi:MAG: DJ-1/PfpI family protein [Negativicutes bacterium]|nr:DJ-1/PfpI family protein [Negativicutes bacterium]